MDRPSCPPCFAEHKRDGADADRFRAVFLDSDTGVALAKLESAVRQRGWAGYRRKHAQPHDHNHAGQSHAIWTSGRRRIRTGTPRQFLIDEKKMLTHIAADAVIEKEDLKHVYFRHQPCPKFRVALPLLAAVARSRLCLAESGQCRVEGARGGTRRCAGPAARSVVHGYVEAVLPAAIPARWTATRDRHINGNPVDLFALPAAKPNGRMFATQAASHAACSDRRTTGRFVDQDTGEVFDLRAWAAEYGHRFKLADALRAKKPEVLTGKIADRKVHIRCPNEDAHTQVGPDAATFVMNAGQGQTAKGFRLPLSTWPLHRTGPPHVSQPDAVTALADRRRSDR